MKKNVFDKEQYEVPSIECLLTKVENGFAASGDPSGGFDHEDSETDWVEGED